MAHDLSEPDPQRGSAARRTADAPASGERLPRGINFNAWNLLLVIPLIGTLIPGFYNKKSPELGGIPFFYWYQMMWILISVAITYFVYRVTRGER